MGATGLSAHETGSSGFSDLSSESQHRPGSENLLGKGSVRHLTADRARTRVDYDLHGIVGVRLLNPSPGDVAAVDGQLGPIRRPLGRPPEIVIHFADQLPDPPLRYLGVEDAGFSRDGFFVLSGKGKSRVRVRIPFDQIGGHCHIHCEKGLPAVPLLVPILNLTALAKGVLPLHASAFDYQGVGVLATGWAKGGKTETLLAFAANGANYVGDEWVYINDEGRMYGIPEPIRIWDWHLQNLPQFRSCIGRRDRVRLWTLRRLVGLVEGALRQSSGRSWAWHGLARRLRALLKDQQWINIAPRDLFGPNSKDGATFERLLFVASHREPRVTVRPADPRKVARRMVFSLQEERMRFMSYYRKFRFAFPEASNEFIEGVEELERSALRRLLTGKETYSVYHPYPVPMQALFHALHPLWGQAPGQPG
ncbi:MAG: hypothetical protein ACE5JX_00085 [Acidobacteriota bacterium]